MKTISLSKEECDLVISELSSQIDILDEEVVEWIWPLGNCPFDLDAIPDNLAVKNPNNDARREVLKQRVKENRRLVQLCKHIIKKLS